MAKIKSDGTYSLSSYRAGDGVPLGDYDVAIECVEYPKETAAPKSFEEELAMENNAAAKAPIAPPNWIIPEIFSSPDTSGLRVTVKKNGNSLDFSLP